MSQYYASNPFSKFCRYQCVKFVSSERNALPFAKEVVTARRVFPAVNYDGIGVYLGWLLYLPASSQLRQVRRAVI